MQDLIKRYFWVLGGAVVMVCSVFAANTQHTITVMAPTTQK